MRRAHARGRPGSRRPGLVFTGPFTGTRDQVTGTYAARLAEAGFVTLAFDHRSFGEPARFWLIAGSGRLPVPVISGQCRVARAMSGEAGGGPVAPPGAERPRRYRPKLRYELLDCGLHMHELLGTDAARLRDEDSLFAREADGLRWYRCLRCDSWVALSPPAHPAVQHPPQRQDVALPLRGRPLRDRYVLRLIALDRMLHFLALSALSVALILFAHNRAKLTADFTRILDLQGGLGGPVNNSSHGIVRDLRRLFAVNIANLYLVAAATAAYAALEGAEAVGLWLTRRWAEYLTFVAAAVVVPYGIYELTRSISWLKLLSLVINLLIVVYLVVAKRLFGARGGRTAERAEIEHDTGWAAIERATPGPGTPVAPPPNNQTVSPD
jgi:uncharacterized membrane protein (DUF2068 family)